MSSALEIARKFVAENIKPLFHDQRLLRLEELELERVLKGKNPYLFRAKAVAAAPDMVKQILDAHLSSAEETLFGKFLEALAIQVSRVAFGGIKSTSPGIDLEFTRNSKRYAVSIKSGPKWANASQKAKMIQDFNRAKQVAKQGGVTIECVEGCCYGKDARPHKVGGYLKLCGQDFWTLVSDDATLYQDLVEPLGYQARQRCDEFEEAYGRARTRFTQKFTAEFCFADGAIDWPKLLELNSGSRKPWAT
jgi:hypothetical protein